METNNIINKCKYCGQPVKEQYNFCPFCGEALTHLAKSYEFTRMKTAQVKLILSLTQVVTEKKTLDVLKAFLAKIEKQD